MNRRIYALIGMMGSGKTTLGRLLARRLGIDFIDADAVLEEETGMTVPDFFRQYGEAAFREKEREIIETLTARPDPAVLATGGGAFCQPAIRDHLLRHAVTVFLRVDRDELLRRLAESELSERPVLAGPDWRGRVKELVRMRYPLYEMARHVVDIADELPVHTVGRLERLLSASEAQGESAC